VKISVTKYERKEMRNHFILCMLFETFTCATILWNCLRTLNCFHEGCHDINQPSLISHFHSRKKKKNISLSLSLSLGGLMDQMNSF
jgi:hypothetical protein